MKTILLFSLFLSFQAWSQDYVKVGGENEFYRDFTREEFETKLGENKALLPHYACNGINEFNPFYEPVRTNEKGDSLRIKAYQSEELIVYREGKYFDLSGNEITEITDKYYKHLVKALSQFEKLESTKKLLRLLEHSHFNLTITLGRNSFVPTVEGGDRNYGIYQANAIHYIERGRMPEQEERIVFQDIGVGGFIQWHPNIIVTTIEQDNVRRELNPQVALAHEMFHAFDSIRGLLDMRSINGIGYEPQLGSEYRAVYFENMVRKELGILYRKYYGHTDEKEEFQDFSQPGVLDSNNEPYLIQAPCL